jgi:hypothetical protein
MNKSSNILRQNAKYESFEILSNSEITKYINIPHLIPDSFNSFVRENPSMIFLSNETTKLAKYEIQLPDELKNNYNICIFINYDDEFYYLNFFYNKKEIVNEFIKKHYYNHDNDNNDNNNINLIDGIL